MLKNHTKLSALIALSVLVIGCNSTPINNVEEMNVNIPQWVLNPSIEKGLASSSCVIASNSFSMDKSEVATLARGELASQIETKVSSLYRNYTTRVTSMGKTITESKVGITSAQLTDQYLLGSDVRKIEYVRIRKVRNLCAMVTLPPNKMKGLFNQLINETPIKLSPEDESALYLDFIELGHLEK